MPTLELLPWTVTTVTVLSVLTLCAALFAYSQGWLTRMRPAPRKVVNNKAGNGRAINKKSGRKR